MKRTLGTALAVVALVSLPAVARAQMTGMPTHEFGVDVGLAYSHVGSGCTTDCGTFSVSTPVDVRIGFISSGPMMVEPRFTFALITGGGTLIMFDPDVNVLFRMGAGTGMQHLMGPYLTAGVGAHIESLSPSGGGTSTSGAAFAINGGIGTRVSYGSGATRAEAFVKYIFESAKIGVPATLQVGARLGLSLFH
jgi:hypothetical protein